MAIMMAKLYAALRAGNVPEPEAREAAEEAAAVHDRLDNLDRGLDGVKAEISALRTEVKGEIALLRTELIGEIAHLRTESKGETANLRTGIMGEIASLRAEFKGEIRRLEWLLTGLLAIAVAVAGKYFLHG